jgi:hypothetical protein
MIFTYPIMLQEFLELKITQARSSHRKGPPILEGATPISDAMKASNYKDGRTQNEKVKFPSDVKFPRK